MDDYFLGKFILNQVVKESYALTELKGTWPCSRGPHWN